LGQVNGTFERHCVDWRQRKLIEELYVNQSAFVKVGGGLSEVCMIGDNVRQGFHSLHSCILLMMRLWQEKPVIIVR